MSCAVAGYINTQKKITSDLLGGMAEEIKHSSEINIKIWQDQILAISLAGYNRAVNSAGIIFNENKTLALALIGEIFDYEEQKSILIEKGYKFKLANDPTEFCLHLYAEKGNSAFLSLNGSFSLVIYNLRSKELLLVSDRFASQPIFYHLSEQKTLLFGSQVACILKSNEFLPELNKEAIFEFFTFLQVLGTKTFFKNIEKLAPATIMTYHEGHISFSEYWSFKYHEKPASEQYYVEKLAQTIKTAVQRRTQGGQRVGLLLSGGLDSRMILSASEKNMVCFTVGDLENKEVKTAKNVCEIKGYKHVFLKRDPDHYLKLLNKAVDIGDGLYSFTHAYAIGFFEQISRECDVVLHGFALERFFRGTLFPLEKFSLFGIPVFKKLDKLTGSCLSRQFLAKFKTSIFRLNPEQLFAGGKLNGLNKVLLQSIKKVLDEGENICLNQYDAFAWPNIRYPQGFAFLNVSSIRAFMNERSIIFDNDLLDLHLQMPVKYRANSKIWNKAMARLNNNIAKVPNANKSSHFLWIVKIWQKTLNKIGFVKSAESGSPIFTQGSWPNFFVFIREHKKMRDLVAEIIKDPQYISPDIFDLQGIKQVYNAYMQGNNAYSILLYLLLTFGIWYKKYGLNSIIKENKA